MTRDINKIDDDIISAKRIISQKLCNDPDIIESLNNSDLDPESPDEYLNVNIFSYLRIPGTQDTIKNYICFNVDDIEQNEDNQLFKQQYVQFAVFSHDEDIHTPYGINRHDLIAYLIRDIFNWSNILGLQLKCVYNRESSMDNRYSCRTLKFEATKPNSLHKGVATNKYEFVRNR